MNPSLNPVTAAAPFCPSCRKPLARARISRVFPAHHERCIERAVAIARAEHGPD